MLEEDLIEKLRISEEQIANGEAIDADTVFKKMKEKYGH